MDRDLVATVSAASDALGSSGELLGEIAGASPRFELFHAAASICSQKVRAVLAHHRLPYVSHSLNIFHGQTYLPGYVRLRMLGCDAYGGALAAHHSGSTSAAAGGCDGAVVPTLIDWQTGEVVVDSLRICSHLDALIPQGERLRPHTLAKAIDDELAIIDDLPNYQMLMGRAVSGTESAVTRDSVGATLSQKKVALCDRYLAEFPHDGPLVAAYSAKRAKELSASEQLFSPEAMRVAYDRIELALLDLEARLAGPRPVGLGGNTVSMADLFWGIQLLRMKNTGVAHFWEAGRLPHVEQFSAATEQIAAIRTAVIDWPGAMY